MKYCVTIFLTLFVLKMSGLINCSWYWVLSPLPVPLILLILAVYLPVALLIFWGEVFNCGQKLWIKIKGGAK